MNSYKAALLGAITALGCSIAVANSDDHHAVVEKPVVAEEPAKPVQKKKTARASKKAGLKDTRGRDAHYSASLMQGPVPLDAQPAEVVRQPLEAHSVDQSSFSQAAPAAPESTLVVAQVAEVAVPAAEPVRLTDATERIVAPVRYASETVTVCTPPSKAEVVALFDRWNASLRTGDPKKVVVNYAPFSVLLLSASNKARFSAAEKEDYFQYFLARKPVGKIDDRLIEMDCRSASDSGLYTFTFNDGSVVKARYSFVYKKIGDDWLITSHHSSGMPEKPESAVKPAARATEQYSAIRGDARAESRIEPPSRSQGWVKFP